jgi:hypothetical protein
LYLAQVLNNTAGVFFSWFSVISASDVQMRRTPVSIRRTAEKKDRRRTCNQTRFSRALIVEVHTHLKECSAYRVVLCKEGARKRKSFSPSRTDMTSLHSIVSRSRFREIPWNTQMNILKYRGRFQISLEMTREFLPTPPNNRQFWNDVYEPLCFVVVRL